MEALTQWSEANTIDEVFKQKVIPYLQSHIYQWPAHIRYLGADLLEPGDTPEEVLILVGGYLLGLRSCRRSIHGHDQKRLPKC